MPFARHDLAGFEVDNIRANLCNLADKLMADNHGNRDSFLCPAIPIINMQVRPADCSPQNFDQHIIGPNGGHGNIFQPKPRFCMFFYKRTHFALRLTLRQIIGAQKPAAHIGRCDLT